MLDERIYHYEYRRPRNSNPTYSSNNVNSSMTYFMKGKDENSSHPQQQPTNNNPQKSNLPSIPNYNPSEQQRSTTVIKIDQSYLSNYGTKSLGYNERDIYNKQNKNFNIISLKPKQYNETIKQYPKFSLQDKDSFYYRKMQKMHEQEQDFKHMRASSMQMGQEKVIAGKNTFAIEQGKNKNYYQHGRYFTPRMLNHADQVSSLL